MDNKENNKNEEINSQAANVFGSDILREDETSQMPNNQPENNSQPEPSKQPAESTPAPGTEEARVLSHYQPKKKEYTKFTPDGKSLNEIAEESKAASEKAQTQIEKSSFAQNSDIVEDELYEAYMGKRYKKFQKRKFSFAAFIFGPFYLMYRKMYFRGVFIYLLMCFLAIYIWKVQELNYIIIAGIYFIVALLIGLSTNKRYMNKATNQILNLKGNNPKASNEGLIRQCQTMGGTNFSSVIVIVIVFAIASYLFSLYVFQKITPAEIRKLEFKDVLEKINFNKQAKEKTTENSKNKSQSLISQKFSYIIPEIFIANDNTNGDGIGYTYKVDDTNYCSLSFLSYASDLSVSEFIEDKAIQNSEDAAPGTKTINGINWTFYDYLTENLKTFNYAIDDNGKIYMYRFIITTKDTNLDQRCQMYHDNIINSITMKNQN